MTSFNSSGSKYLREIIGNIGSKIDVYGILLTFDVQCPARQHAIKKLLCSGLRGKASLIQDLKEARDAIDRAIQIHDVQHTQEKVAEAVKYNFQQPGNIHAIDMSVSVPNPGVSPQSVGINGITGEVHTIRAGRAIIQDPQKLTGDF